MTPLAPIDIDIEIDAPVTRVWETLSEPALVEQWLGCIAFRAELGALFYMQPDSAKRAAGDMSGATHCVIEALDPPHRLRFSWFMPGTPKTYVTLTATEIDAARTRVRLVHDGWEAFEPDHVRAIRDMLGGGWRGFVLPGLKNVCETHARN